MTVSFTIPGRPVGKGRPRFARRGDQVTTFTDGKTASFENKVALFAQQAMRGHPMFEGPVCLTVHAFFAPPASASRVKRAAMLAGALHPTVKPDLDNTCKAILDGLQGIAFRDDVTVTWINAGKRYAETDSIFVQVEADTLVVLQRVEEAA